MIHPHVMITSHVLRHTYLGTRITQYIIMSCNTYIKISSYHNDNTKYIDFNVNVSG